MTLVMGPEVREALTRLVGRWRDQVATYRDDLPGWIARAGVERCARELEDRLSAIPDGAWRAAHAALAEPDGTEATDV